MDNKNFSDSKENESKDSLFGEVISSYSQEQAVEDGVLVCTGNWGDEKVYFTSALFAQGYKDQMKRLMLVELGLKLLRRPDPEDTPEMRLRVIEEGKIWVIWNLGYGLTFLRPDDY